MSSLSHEETALAVELNVKDCRVYPANLNKRDGGADRRHWSEYGGAMRRKLPPQLFGGAVARLNEEDTLSWETMKHPRYYGQFLLINRAPARLLPIQVILK